MRQLEDWFFTRGAGDPPEEYLDYKLCREVYHCPPDALEAQDARTVDLHLQFYLLDLAEQAKAERAHSGKTRMRLGGRKRPPQRARADGR